MLHRQLLLRNNYNVYKRAPMTLISEKAVFCIIYFSDTRCIIGVCFFVLTYRCPSSTVELLFFSACLFVQDIFAALPGRVVLWLVTYENKTDLLNLATGGRLTIAYVAHACSVWCLMHIFVCYWGVNMFPLDFYI